MARRTLLITYIATYLIAISTIFRYLTAFRDHNFWTIALLLPGYLLLLLSEPIILRKYRQLIYLYLIIQAIIIGSLSFINPNVDFWAALFFPLVLQTMVYFPTQVGYFITGIITVIMATLMLLGLGFEIGFPIIFINGVVYFFLATFIAILGEAETARAEAENKHAALLAAQETIRQGQMEKAIAEERSRLARELHDSVTQSLHSSTLLAEAGQRLVSSGDIERTRGYLVRLGEISQQALKEMRLLVYELRPLVLKELGLAGALQQRLDAVERRSGVDVNLSLEEGLEIPPRIEEALFRVAMEALNNALKHANPSTVTVALSLGEKRGVPCIELAVIDDGSGFDPDEKTGEGGLGLVSMHERIEKLGGELTVLSSPGEGTQIWACLLLEKTPQPSGKSEA